MAVPMTTMNRKLPRWLHRAQIGAGLLIFQALTGYARCTPPPYRDGATFADSEEDSVLVHADDLT